MAKDLRNILLSEIEENKIKEKTPDKLPLNPTAMGWSGQEVRRFLAKSLIDNEGSFLAEFKKKMAEIKAQFEDVFGDGDGNIQGQIDSIIQDIASIEENNISELETIILNNYNTLDNIKVNKTLTILGIDLQNDITLSEFKTALGDATTFTNGLMSALDKENLAQTMIDIQNLFSNKADKTDIPTNVSQLNNDSGYITDYTETDPIFKAWNKSTGINITKSQVRDLIEATQALSGLMSATDKQRLDVLHALLEEDTENNVVDSINEVLSIFNNYPEGADLVSAFAGKVDKVSGKGLSTNDFTNNDKNKLDGIEAGAEVNEVNSVNGKQGVVVLNQDNVGDGVTYKQVSQAEKNTWNGKQNKLVAGNNITIDENTNVISASGEGDKNALAYFDYAASVYGDKYSLLASAWEHSITVDPLEISADSSYSNPRKGIAQYPNGETEGVIIPQGVTSIGDSAFNTWSENNKPLVIPSSVTSIGSGAFIGWSSNNHPLIIPNTVTSIDSAFSGWSSNNHPLIISNSVTSISNGAFSYWTSNNQPLVIPDSVTNIETGAFQYWISNNQPLVIPNSVTSIGYYAFRDWESNTHPLVIPESVTSIGQYAFERWSLVPYVEIHATIPPTLVNADAFYNQDKAPIYVPDESVDDYKTATQWDMLANRIFPMSDKPDLGDLHENKLNKIWTDITEQPTTSLTDILIFNRDSNVYKTTVAKLLAQVDNEIFEVVNPLPATGVANKIYLVPSSDPEKGNTLDEFIWINSDWEKIGAVSVDLSNILDGKQDKLIAGDNITIDPTTNVISASGGGGEVDFDAMYYFNYASSFYGDKYSLLVSAWEHSLTLSPSDIIKAKYPNGETEGVIIPQGITIIGSEAFSFWEANNQPLVIPNSVTRIQEGAFRSWSANNQPLVIPNSVTTIDASAFIGWSANTHPLVIPSSVTSIGGGAFSGWWKVPYAEIQAITPPTLTHSVTFDFGYKNPPIYVPDESVDAYKEATIWASLADRIFPISDKPDLMDDIADLQENKQDKLVAGENITIEDNVISASVGSGGFLPDDETITLNGNDELEATNVAIWRYE